MENKKGNLKFRLDLDKSRRPQAYKGKDNLWGEDLSRVFALLQKHVEKVDEHYQATTKRSRLAEDTADERPSLAIAIFGPSGSGKSSLLRTLTRYIRDRREIEPNGMVKGAKPPRLASRLRTLPVMEPSIWAEDDNFLYAFLASALEADRKACEAETDDVYPQGLSPVQLSFQEVNDYLQVLDKKESAQEYDPLGLSLQRLERHTSGLRLREKLDELIAKLARQLGEDQRQTIILLPVDDLDMAPDHLIEALKTFQSFLMHPQLVPVFTFTDRMPEELIRVQYQRSLALAPVPDDTSASLLGDRVPAIDRRRLQVSEQLAVQFLSRCFPVRNRIRLGPAPGRVQRAEYQVYKPKGRGPDSGENGEKPKVLHLLTTASFLLYGHPDRDDVHCVRAALRPSTLRRQLQIFDAMVDVNVEAFMVRQFEVLSQLTARAKAPIGRLSLRNDLTKPYQALEKSLDSVTGRKHYTWATVFNAASWSLFNVHRDTLRELRFFLEDLYSWAPRELRSVVLGKVLAEEGGHRRTIVDRWLNRTDYRRSQVLSLLVANVHRPWMRGEEPFGDEEGPLRWQRIHEFEADGRGDEFEGDDPWRRLESHDARLSFSAAKGFVWFANVTIGFYLPLVMVRNWDEASPDNKPVSHRMSGNGWDLPHGPLNAIRIADAKQDQFSFGMMFLNRQAFQDQLKNKKLGQEARLLLRIWSCYGYSRGRYWAGVSLWRGLGLMARILDVSLSWPRPDAGAADATKDELYRRHKKEIRGILRAHCLSGMVPGSLLQKKAKDKGIQFAFERWEPKDLEGAIKSMAGELHEWIENLNDLRIYPMPAPEQGDQPGIEIRWRECFLRRIHGEYVLGSLWPRLNSAYLETQAGQKGEDDRWTARTAIGAWAWTLLHYWRGNEPILRLLLSCPLFLQPSDLKERLQEFEKESENRFVTRWPGITFQDNAEQTAGEDAHGGDEVQPTAEGAAGAPSGAGSEKKAGSGDLPRLHFGDLASREIPGIFEIERSAVKEFSMGKGEENKAGNGGD